MITFRDIRRRRFGSDTLYVHFVLYVTRCSIDDSRRSNVIDERMICARVCVETTLNRSVSDTININRFLKGLARETMETSYLGFSQQFSSQLIPLIILRISAKTDRSAGSWSGHPARNCAFLSEIQTQRNRRI